MDQLFIQRDDEVKFELDKYTIKEWASQTKQYLMEMEQNNLRIRADSWTHIVNRETQRVNMAIFVNNVVPASLVSNKFDSTLNDVEMKKCCSFLYEWKGFNLKQSVHPPTSLKSYQMKAKNWLVGRRAKMYANTIYPIVIHNSIAFAKIICNAAFDDENVAREYATCLIYSYLCVMCSEKISLNDVTKKTYFLCDNSIKIKKNEIKLIFQEFAGECIYKSTFPSHRQQCIDHFRKALNKQMQHFRSIYYSNRPSNDTEYMELVSLFDQLVDQQKEMQPIMHKLSSKITLMESNCFIIQSQIIDAMSTDSNN